MVRNKNSIYSTLGASNHVQEEREQNDFYATEPKAVKLLLEQEDFSINIWEPAVGQGHIADILKDNNYLVVSSDIVDRGYKDTHINDFLTSTIDLGGGCDIVTNPPYKYASQFVEKSFNFVRDGGKVAMFLKVLFLESNERKKMFKKYPPKVVYVSSGRLACSKNGKFDKNTSRAVAYAWFVWEKGFEGDPIIKWIN